MKNISLKEMLDILVTCVLENRQEYPNLYYRNGYDEYHSIVEVDLLRGRFCTVDNDFSEFEWELENSNIYIDEEEEMSDKWFLIRSKEDDYGGCIRDLVKCKKKDLKNVYEYEEVPEEDLEVLKKYFNVLNSIYDEEDLMKRLEEKYE